jgi:hypothetical protein
VLLVFNTTFRGISVISWRSVLSVEETGVSLVTVRLSYMKLYRVHLAMSGNRKYIGIALFNQTSVYFEIFYIEEQSDRRGDYDRC